MPEIKSNESVELIISKAKRRICEMICPEGHFVFFSENNFYKAGKYTSCVLGEAKDLQKKEYAEGYLCYNCDRHYSLAELKKE